MAKTMRSRALLGVAAFAVAPAAMLATAAPAFAQDDEAEDDEIVVTGSRIQRKDLTSTSPVFTASGEQIRLQGAVNVEEFLNELPQIIPGLNQNSNNPSLGGIATLDLRAIGANRTLILIDGNRMTPATNSGVYDVNVIPAGLIERTEVVTGGASAVYGSDAIAGVINFILRDDFEGVEGTTQYTISEGESHETFSANLLMGGNFADGRGNATLYFDYLSRESLLQGDLPFGFDQGSSARSSRNEEGRLSGQAANPYDLASWNAATGNGTFCLVDANNDGICEDADASGTLDNDDFSISGSQNLQFNPDGTLQGPSQLYNYAPVNAAILPFTRFTGRGSVRYEVFEGHEFSTTVTYSSNQLQQQLAPTPVDLILEDPLALANNPLVNSDIIALLESRPDPNAPTNIRRRTTEVGNRIGDIDRKYFEVNFQLKGDLEPLGDDWNYSIFGKFGRVDDDVRNFNNVSASRFINGLSGCPAGSTPDCVPLSIFGQGSLEGSGADYISLNTAESLTFTQDIVTAVVTGPLFDLPAGSVQFAGGYEYRDDESQFFVSDAQANGDIQGFNAIQDISGEISVHELYGEVLIPVFNDAPFAETFEIEGGVRYSDYSTVGGLLTWKVGGSWAPVEDIRFRAIYNEAARSPNIFELFQAGDANFPQYQDPCNVSNTPDAATQAFCIAQGVPAAAIPTFQQDDTQVEALLVGNDQLTEEKASTLTIGAVIQPRFVPGLVITADYYNIEIEDFITRSSIAQTINGCFDSMDLANVFCQGISRNTTSGQIDQILQVQANLEQLETEGFDFVVEYNTEFADLGLGAIPGSFSTQNSITYVTTYNFGGTDLVGSSGGGAGGAIPQLRVNALGTYSPTDRLNIQWQAQRLGSTAQPFGNFFPDEGDLPVVWYHDLAVSYDVNDNVQLFGGIDNITDKLPPLSTDFTGLQFDGQSGTDPSTYDILRRRYRVGFTIRL
ncbi:MAG: TonB-dependent receptor [Pseudomonadota bacterium]